MTGSGIWPSWSWKNAASAASSFPRRARWSGYAIAVRYRARREIERRPTDGLSAEQLRRLDALTNRRSEAAHSWLAWLRQMPEATKPTAMLGLIERLNHVRAIGLDPARAHRVHQARLAQLARETSRTTAQHIAGYEPRRRHAALTAAVLDLKRRNGPMLKGPSAARSPPYSLRWRPTRSSGSCCSARRYASGRRRAVPAMRLYLLRHLNWTSRSRAQARSCLRRAP